MDLIILLIVLLWLGGFLTGVGNLIHLLLLIVIILVIFRLSGRSI